MGELKSFIGEKYGFLTVIERVENAIDKNGKIQVRYKCLCDCGNEKIIRKCHLASGAIVSCGCYGKKKFSTSRIKHGFSHKERLYAIWLDMKERCRNPKNNHYMSYGGRGIVVCHEWNDDYLAFRTWCLENGYKEEIRESGRNNITLDRIDVNGNYSPDNCRFITNKENCLNKRDTMTDEERYNICPVCGNEFVQKKRNGQKSCSAKCGQVLRKKTIQINRSKDGKFQKKEL